MKAKGFLIIAIVCALLVVVVIKFVYPSEDLWAVTGDSVDLLLFNEGRIDIKSMMNITTINPSNDIIFYAPTGEEVGRLTLTNPMSFTGQVDKSAEAFFNYFIRYLIKNNCKQQKELK